RFRDLPQEQELSIPPRGTLTAWVLYADLLQSGHVPHMVLELTHDGRREQIDVNDAHRTMLKLTHERIGPRGILGLLTIAGDLDTVNVGSMVEELDRLSNQGSTRAVVSFAESAAPLPNALGEWLEQTACQRDPSGAQARFPAITPTISDLHLAALPIQNAHTVESPDGRPHLHRAAAAAVETSLEPVFRNLPAIEVVEQIEHGHPLARVAALATGGHQLSHEHLPLILPLAETDDLILTRGALIALGEIGHPEATEAIVRHARSESAAVATLAVECLAASRFAAAHDALERLLAEPLHVPLIDLGRILARFPRAPWMDTLCDMASGVRQEEGASVEQRTEVRRDALIALGRIGHPELVPVLGAALAAEDQPIQTAAFALLAGRTDPDSERLAVEYALELTRSTFPSHQILALFQRVRDPRAVPLLIGHLESTEADNTLLIKTLAQIGPANIDQTLVERYGTLRPREQAAVLSSLTELGSSLVLPLAKQGVGSDQNVIFHAAVTALQEIGSPEAIEVLADVLLATSHSAQINSLVRALEGIGTLPALNALRRARFAGDSRKAEAIHRRLLDILQRSPAFPQYVNANEAVQQEKWAEAAQVYGKVLEIDPELSDAYSGRGHCRLHLDEFEPASGDFQQALRSNPYDSLAVTGLAIARVRQGDAELGIRMVEEAAARFPNDWVYAYNAACVYSRAIEAALMEPPSNDRDARITQLQDNAMNQLRLAVERGCDEFDYMKIDPDLAPLRELDEFQKLQPVPPKVPPP
ncbi:MAG: hypothetical protein AB7U20_03585, partial [Planctomycetaceae bacterium]